MRDERKAVRANNQVARAIRAGTLTRPSECSRCGSACRAEGHHADYDKPLDVEWLCKPCHARITGAAIRAAKAAKRAMLASFSV